MSLLFSEYLIEKNFASHEQIIDATIEQLRSIPSMAEIIYDNEFLTKKELLKILNHQQMSGADFYKSAQTMGFLSKEIIEKINKKIELFRKPLSEILIEKKILSLETLTSAFVSYVEETKQETGNTTEDTNIG